MSFSMLEIIVLTDQKIALLITSKGRKNFSPLLESPLLINPITKQDIKSVMKINAREK